MKGSFFFTVSALLLVLFVYLIATRDRVPHLMPGAAPAGSLDAGAGEAVAIAADAGAGEAAGPAKASAEAPAAALGRPLRVAVLGWEHVCPAYAPRPDAGAPAMRGQPVEIAVEAAVAGIESRLAKGGADAQGADVAIFPLPSLVASFERLRALEPRVFFVAGWSTGREELRGTKDATLARAPEGDVKLATTGNDSATFLALFAIERAGAQASRVKLLPPGSPDVKSAPWAAAARGDAVEGDRKLVLNTADARRLIPIVAVASAGALDAQGAVYKTFAQSWLEGLERARADVPAAARQVAAMQGAPDALAILERWGQMEVASLADNAARLGVRGASAVTVASLFARAWSLDRAAGILTSPPPERAPVWPAVVESLAAGAAAPAPAPAPDGADAGALKPAQGAPLLVHREPESAEAAAVGAEAVFLAEVFDRATVRIGGKTEKAARAAFDEAQSKAAGAASRIVIAQVNAPAGYAIEVLPP